MGISVFSGMLAASMPFLGGDEYEAIIDRYRSPEMYSGMDEESKKKFDHQRAIELGAASRLMERMCESGAKVEEYRKLVLYSYLLVHSMKYKLDFPQASKDLNIKEIKTKYENKEVVRCE